MIGTSVFARLRTGGALVLRQMADKLAPLTNVPYSTPGWDHIPQGQYDYMPKGTHVSGPADSYLLVPKNRYRVVVLPEQSRRFEDGVGWLTEDNSPEGYDLLWGNGTNLEIYRAEGNHARDKLKVEIIDRVADAICPRTKVVDIGCGVGDLLNEIRARQPHVEVYGLDFSPKAIEGAKQALPDGDFRRFVIDRTLPYADHSFDIVLCTDVIEHLEYPKTIVAELVRICRPGGTVAVVVPDGDVDQFFGHNWFFNQQRFSELLADWGGVVTRLPVTGEFLGRISVGALGAANA
jgi:SAM-dependent methyltransferase